MDHGPVVIIGAGPAGLTAAYVLSKADVITCDAEHIMETMKRLGAVPEKIRIINYGVDTKKFSPREKSRELKAKLTISNSPIVISLRNLDPLYDVESLIKSVPLVVKEIPEAKFLIAGSGPEESKLKELAVSLDASESTYFVGFIPNDELPTYLTTTDVYVSTALSEGLDSLKIDYEISPYLVRGLDYYTRTVFEVTHQDLGAQDALGAGGRYDSLVSDLGGPDVGAMGFAFGIERLHLLSSIKCPVAIQNLVYIYDFSSTFLELNKLHKPINSKLVLKLIFDFKGR
jgi:histidyl-tRNA synthetase